MSRAPRVHGVAVIFDFCGSAGAQGNAPVCRNKRECFSMSGGRRGLRVDPHSPLPSIETKSAIWYILT
jgi:hypothetical protein